MNFPDSILKNGFPPEFGLQFSPLKILPLQRGKEYKVFDKEALGFTLR